MSENIKPSEVSEVLLQQLKGINTHLQFDEVGNVLQVSDGVARIYGLRNAEANELLEFENGIMAIVMNLEEDNVGATVNHTFNEKKMTNITATVAITFTKSGIVCAMNPSIFSMF